MTNCCNNKVTKGFTSKSIIVDGEEIKYVVYVPWVYDPQMPMPMIVFLNGMGECGTDGLKQLGVGLGTAVILDAEKWPFIIVFPQKQKHDIDWEDQENIVIAALDAARNEYNIDESRIYLTGISQGGHGTWAIAARHTDLFAAIAPVCGWGDAEMARELTEMPTWIFHGEADSVIPLNASTSMYEHIKAAGGSPRLTTYPGVDHNSWDNAYRNEDLAEWFLKHKK